MPDYPIRKLSGWGGFGSLDCVLARPATREALLQLIRNREKAHHILPRGMGRSYGDSAIDPEAVIISQVENSHFISFDSKNGLLHCEAGVTLEEIVNVCLPQGWFLPTTPGTKYVTVGGAIAADVHGKNHHVDGTFGNWVKEIKLALADGSILSCSRDNDPDAFWATIGGMGLTGYILDATIQLSKCSSAYYKVDYKRCSDLDSVLSTLEENDENYRYSVGWIDCLKKGKSLGRSILMLGNDAKASELPISYGNRIFNPKLKPKKSVPFYFPGFALNSLSIRLFNQLFYTVHPDKSTFVDYDNYFYPLDSILNWNRIYGRRGFIQYQALFPPDTAYDGLKLTLETLSKYGLASFLAVIKRSGAANPSPLSYLFEGYTLALDIPNVGERMVEMSKKLDEILLMNKGRLYLAKDSLMTAEVFDQMYPAKAEFMAVKKRLDPEDCFISTQARRLNLYNAS